LIDFDGRKIGNEESEVVSGKSWVGSGRIEEFV